MEQEQFLEVIDRDEAERRFRAVLDLRPLEAEKIPLALALNRVLADDVVAPVDAPSFDRSNVDGFAVRAEDTFGASEEKSRLLRLNPEILATGVTPKIAVDPGTATTIATGAIVPRGSNAVIMIEYTDAAETTVQLRRPATPGMNITFAGTDIGRGETVLRRGELLTSRETGVLAALGQDSVSVVRRPRVAVLSTGDELIPPGSPMRAGLVFDSNARVLADAVRELGGEPVPMGIVPDDQVLLEQALRQALGCDVVLLSGGTSKGAGDLSYRVVGELGKPGIVAHGVALKPGKPLCLAAVEVDREQGRKTIPVAILPGFPTSAIFTFHEFLAPVIRSLAGRPHAPVETVPARLPFRVNSERGRTEYLLVNLVSEVAEKEHQEQFKGEPRHLNGFPAHHHTPFIAYPMGKGSGSVTAFSRADGFVIIPRQREYLEAEETVAVHLLGAGLQPADLVVIGSHCVGLDYLLGRLHELGFHSKFLAVGSTGGLVAARRGECDLAGVHLLHPETNTYNRPYVDRNLILIPGYARLQGILFRRGDGRFEGRSVADAVAQSLHDPRCILINRNRGSGTRVLIDRLLGESRPPGYLAEAKSHNAVAAAVAQGRADWGVAIANVATDGALGFLPLQEEQYDFLIPRARRRRPAVQAFCDLLDRQDIRQALAQRGFRLSSGNENISELENVRAAP
jgi:putative molybdopterin biosynthesis protein